MNYTEFSKQIKEKYPYYKNVDDRELAQKIVEKYPYYKDKVTFDDNENKTTVGEVVKNMFAPVTEAVSNVADFASVKPYNNNVTEKKQPELRARTAQDDNAKVIYEPNGFDILGEKIAVASATDKGATTTKDLEDIKKKQNFAMMTAGVVPFVAGGQMSVGGLVILESIQQAKNYFASKIKGKNYDFMAYENLSSLLPDNTPSVVRVVSSLAEMVADCVVAGRLETAGRNFLINEAVGRLETKMKGAGYNEEQVKTASDNLKKEIVKRETGLKEENGQVVQTEAKPMNIDEAVKLNVDVEKLKVPKAEQPKETIKADVEVEEIKEPKQIKPVEEVKTVEEVKPTETVKVTEEVKPTEEYVGDFKDEASIRNLIDRNIENSSKENIDKFLDKNDLITYTPETSNKLSKPNLKATSVTINSPQRIGLDSLYLKKGIFTNGVIAVFDKDLAGKLYKEWRKANINYYAKQESGKTRKEKLEKATKSYDEDVKTRPVVKIENVIPNLKTYKEVKPSYITKWEDGKDSYMVVFDNGVAMNLNTYNTIKDNVNDIKVLYSNNNKENKPFAFLNSKDELVAIAMPVRGNFEEWIKNYNETPKQILNRINSLVNSDLSNEEIINEIYKATKTDMVNYSQNEIKELEKLEKDLPNVEFHKDYMQRFKPEQIAEARKSLNDELKKENPTEERKKEIKELLDLFKEKETEEGQKQILNAEKEYNDLVKKINDIKDKGKKQKESFVNSLKEKLNAVDKETMAKREQEKKDLQKKKTIDRIKEIDKEIGYYDTEIFMEERLERLVKEKKSYANGIPNILKLSDIKNSRNELLKEREELTKNLNKEDLAEIEKTQAEVKEQVEKEIEERTFQEREDARVANAFIKDYNKPHLTKEKVAFFADGGNEASNEFKKLTPKERLEVKFAILREYGFDNAYQSYRGETSEEIVNFKVELAKLGYINEEWSNLGFGRKNSKDKRDLQSLVKERTKEESNVATSKTDFTQQTDVELPKVTKTHDELIKKSEIIRDLAKEVDLPVKIGGTQRKNILGLYYMKEELVRLQVANDMLTLAHEIGHHEEKVLFGGVYRKFKDFTPEQKEFYKELKPLATKPAGNETRGKMFSEGLAQFISMFVNNPAQAQQVAPKFYKFFTEQAPIKTPIQYEALKKAQAQMSKYYSQNATNTVKSHISFKEESPKLTVKEKFDNITESIRTQLFDRLEPLRQAVRKTYQKAGMEISDTEVNNPYFLARLYSGAVGRAEVFLNKHTYDFKTLQKTGKALGDIIKDIHNKGGNLEDFASYLVAHDTIELAKRNINSGVELEAAKETVNLLKPIYDSYAQELYQYRLSLLKMLKDGQVITDEAYNNIINAGERYAPLQRVLDDKVIKTVGGRNFKSKNPLKSIKGSGRDIINPLETIVEDTYNVIKLVEKNRVGLALAKLSRLDKSGAFVFGPIHKTKTVRDIEGNEAIGSDYTIDENNEIKVFVNGKPQIYEVDKSIAKIMNGLTLSNQILYSQTLEAVATLPAKMLKFGATDVNVAFAFKNILRDLPVALVSTENKFSVISENVLKLTVLGLKAFTNEKARLEWNEIADQMNKAGGGQSLLINDNRDSTIKAIDDLNYSGYLDKIWNKVKERDFIEAAKTGIIGTTEAVRALVGFLEQVPRMAEFVSSLEGKPLTKENLEQAGFNARKITLDFASGGNLAKWINKYVPYENAFFLGIGKIAEVIKTPKMFKRLLGVLGAYAIINVLGRLINGDDEEVNDVNRTQKYTNFVFKIGDTIYRIPKTIELAPFYTTIDTAINAIFDTIKGTKTDKKEYLKDIYGSIEANLVPNVLPQVAKLPLELYANKSMFFKTPIVSAELEKVLPEYQYTEYTTELAKFIANTLGNIGINKGLIAATIGSPQRLEYIVNSLTGNTGKYLFEKADQIGRATGILPDKEYELPEKTLADIPFARAFVIRYPAQSRSIQEFYEKYKEMKRYEDTFKLAKKRADIDTVKEMAIYQSVNKVSKISKSMSDIRKVILETYTNKDMNKNEKRQAIDELMLTRLALAKQGLNVMKEIEENIKEEK